MPYWPAVLTHSAIYSTGQHLAERRTGRESPREQSLFRLFVGGCAAQRMFLATARLVRGLAFPFCQPSRLTRTLKFTCGACALRDVPCPLQASGLGRPREGGAGKLPNLVGGLSRT